MYEGIFTLPSQEPALPQGPPVALSALPFLSIESTHHSTIHHRLTWSKIAVVKAGIS